MEVRLVIFQANFSPNIFLLLTTLIKILMLTNANFVIKCSVFRDNKSEYIYQTKGIINKKPPPSPYYLQEFLYIIENPQPLQFVYYHKVWTNFLNKFHKLPPGCGSLIILLKSFFKCLLGQKVNTMNLSTTLAIYHVWILKDFCRINLLPLPFTTLLMSGNSKPVIKHKLLFFHKLTSVGVFTYSYFYVSEFIYMSTIQFIRN